MTIVATYTVQIKRYGDEILLLDADELESWINETEENLTDLLPEGYKAKIDRWDDDSGRECDHKWRDYSEYGGDFKEGELTCKYCGATKQSEGNPDE